MKVAAFLPAAMLGDDLAIRAELRHIAREQGLGNEIDDDVTTDLLKEMFPIDEGPPVTLMRAEATVLP